MDALHTPGPDVDVVDRDPEWVVVLPRGHPGDARVGESLGAVVDGRVGTRGALEEDGPSAGDLVQVAGCWTDTPASVGLPAPLWTRVDLDVGSPGERCFDCRTGVLERRVDGDATTRTLRFACVDRPGTQVLRVDGRVLGDGGVPLQLPEPVDGVDGTAGGDARRAWAVTRSGPTIVVAGAVQSVEDRLDGRRLDRVAHVARAPSAEEGTAHALATARAAAAVGVDGLLEEQRRGWSRRWEDAHLRVLGHPELTLGARFAVHHLLVAADEVGEAAVGARGLTGPAYAGHVFWDADVYVLPALAALRPEAARAMLRYRLARLPEARAAAAAEGHAGACFPWESARTGDDVTPRAVLGPDGDVVPVLTGGRALHITADIAWAAWRWATWTGDRAWLAGEGRELVLDPARYWAARVEVDADGTGHLRGVIGPDEYHGPVDDDVHTNVMARWNLRAAAALAAAHRGLVRPDERDRWLDVADRIVVLHDPVSGRHEQFEGFDRLEPLLISAVTPPPVAADVLLGRHRVAGAQVVKQPDVLMAHHLVPDEMAPGSLGPDLDHEGPRLAHGSSLSPPVVAALLARAGRPDEAEPLFRLAARLDLDDLTDTTAGGLHLATMGGLWQALAGGFAGVEPGLDGLVVRPRLPVAWEGVEVTVRHRGRRVRVRATHREVEVVTDGPVPVAVGEGPVRVVSGRHLAAAPAPPRSEVAT